MGAIPACRLVSDGWSRGRLEWRGFPGGGATAVLTVKQQPDPLVDIAQRRLAGHPPPRAFLRSPQQSDHVIGGTPWTIVGQPPARHPAFLAPLIQPAVQLALYPDAHRVVAGNVAGPPLEVAHDVIGELVVTVEGGGSRVGVRSVAVIADRRGKNAGQAD